jgi:hypothetical protein
MREKKKKKKKRKKIAINNSVYPPVDALPHLRVMLKILSTKTLRHQNDSGK